MNRLNDEDRNQVLQDANVQFWKHILPIVWIAFAIHVVLFVCFLLLNVPVLWVANIGSILAYAVCLRVIRRGRLKLAGAIFCIEIIIHAIIATWMLGWDSNFHYYLFCLVPIIAFSFQTNPVQRLSLNLSIAVLVVGGYALRRHAGVATGISDGIIDAFGVINVLTAIGILIYATALSVRFTLSMQFHLFQTASRDTLTSLYTRRRVLQRVRQLGGEQKPVATALVLLDIDHFKQINDNHGHELGDRVLRRVADSITACVRGSDIASRWGGEEFLVLMPNTSLVDAQFVAERIRQRIKDEAGRVDDTALAVTATLAVTILHPGETFRETLHRADQKLYEGKEAGRDRVMLAS